CRCAQSDPGGTGRRGVTRVASGRASGRVVALGQNAAVLAVRGPGRPPPVPDRGTQTRRGQGWVPRGARHATAGRSPPGARSAERVCVHPQRALPVPGGRHRYHRDPADGAFGRGRRSGLAIRLLWPLATVVTVPRRDHRSGPWAGVDPTG